MPSFSGEFGESFERINIMELGDFSSTSKVLTLNKNTYFFDCPVVIPREVEKVDGNGSTFFFNDSIVGKPLLSNQYSGHSDGGAKRLTITNLNIDGNYSDGPMGRNSQLLREVNFGIRIFKCIDLIIENCRIQNIAGMGCSPVGCTNIQFLNNVIDNTGRDGFTAYAHAKSVFSEEANDWVADTSFINRVINSLIATGNRITNTGDDCIAVWLSNAGLLCKHTRNRNILISNNFLLTTNSPSDKIGGRGIAVGGADGCVISNNIIRNSPNHGIMLRHDDAAFLHGETGLSSTNVSISGNVIKNVGIHQGLGFGNGANSGVNLVGVINYNVTSNVIDGVFKNREFGTDSSSIRVLQSLNGISTDNISDRINLGV